MPEVQQQNQTQQRQQGNQRTPAAGGQQGQQGQQQQPQTPGAPGGGGLTQPLFSGDHVLETVATGGATLKEGARGPSVRAIQSFLAGSGLNIGRTGADGAWGPATTKALQQWQSAHGVPATGVFGQLTLQAMEKEPPVEAPPPGGDTQPPVMDQTQVAQQANRTQATQGANNAAQAGGQAAGAARTQGGAPGSKNGGLPADFQKVWDAHPHNYQADSSQNTSSATMADWLGFDPAVYQNTCAIRLSTMFNQLGGDYKITKEKAVAAGIPAARVAFSKKTGWFYLLSAKEAWTYVTAHFGQPHQSWPNGKRFKTEDEFNTTFESEIEPEVSGKKGIVAFDKIFGYGGTGHVDVFDGKTLSDAAHWYPCQNLKVWYI